MPAALERRGAWIARQPAERGNAAYPGLVSLGIEGNISGYFALLSAGRFCEAAALANAIFQFGWDPAQRLMKPGARPEDPATAIDVIGNHARGNFIRPDPVREFDSTGITAPSSNRAGSKPPRSTRRDTTYGPGVCTPEGQRSRRRIWRSFFVAFLVGVNASSRYSKWPVLSCPLMAGFGCPPRPKRRDIRERCCPYPTVAHGGQQLEANNDLSSSATEASLRMRHFAGGLGRVKGSLRRSLKIMSRP